MNPVLKAALKTHRDFLGVVMQFNEEQLKEMMDYEMAHRPRWSIIERLHQRFCILRAQRERQELQAQCE